MNLQDVIKGINKKYGDIATKGCEGWNHVERLSSGSVSLDYALGGGYPKGKIVELLGNNGSGKSTLCLMAAKEVQDNKGKTLYIDMERALNANRVKSLGLTDNSFISVTPRHGNDAINIMQEALEQGVFDLIVWDSIDSSTPKAELDGDSGDAHMGVKARMINQAMRKINVSLGGTLLMMTNQYRINIGQMYGDNTVTPGGNGPKFYASQRLLINRSEAIKNQLTDSDGEIIGTTIEVRTKKNRFYKPEQRAKLNLMHDGTIREGLYVIDAFISSGLLRQEGNTFFRGDEKLGIKNRVIEYYASDLDKYKTDCNLLIKQVQEQVIDNKDKNTF